MGWTDALKYISDYDEIVRYLDNMYRFHDYRLGNIEYKDGKAALFIEEVIIRYITRKEYVEKLMTEKKEKPPEVALK